MTQTRGASTPGQAVAALTLLVVAATLAWATAAGRPLRGALILHLAVLGAVVVSGWVTRRALAPERAALVDAVAMIVVMFFLYTSLGSIAFDAIPWRADPLLLAADRALGLGHAPGIWLSDRVATHPWAVEGLAAFYGAFIPYLYLTIFLSLVGRPPGARRVFVLAFALLYGVSFMGYLFAPARGPVVAAAGAYLEPLLGGGSSRP